MSSISMFPCSHTSSEGVVQELGSRLGLKIYTDDDLFHDTAQKFGRDIGELKKMMYNKTSVFNKFTLEKNKIVNEFRITLLSLLHNEHNYLFFGFHASLIDPRATEVLRVLVVDNKEGRIKRAAADGVAEDTAKKEIRKHDVSAFSWTDFLFKQEAYHKSLYDLVIPVNDKTPAEITETIQKYFHKTAVLSTVESQQKIKDLAIEAEIIRKLLRSGHNVPVTVEGAVATVTVPNVTIDFNDTAGQIKEIALQEEGVDEVRVSKVKDPNESIYRRQKFDLPSKVLFVDDEREFVETVSHRLVSRDVGTYGVYSGDEALQLIEDDRPEVMVLDLKMPGMHGIEVLRRTKEMAPDIEVIILTGHGTVKDENECMALGAFAYLNKPVDIQKLSSTIQAAHEKVRARTEALLHHSGNA
jgi:two-component system response regulator CpxR